MPREMRQITFEADELAVASLEYLRHRNKVTPDAGLHGIDFTEEADIGLKLKVRGQADEAELVLDSGDVGAALILFCIRRQIRLPMAGVKTIARHGREVHLNIVTDRVH
jgi:hypothetical protein